MSSERKMSAHTYFKAVSWQGAEAASQVMVTPSTSKEVIVFCLVDPKQEWKC